MEDAYISPTKKTLKVHKNPPYGHKLFNSEIFHVRIKMFCAMNKSVTDRSWPYKGSR